MEEYYPYLFPLIFMVLGGGLIFVAARKKNTKKNIDKGVTAIREEEPAEPELTDKFYVGKYVGGLSGNGSSCPFVYCGVTDHYFIFTRGTRGVEVGRIPRTAVTKIVVEDTSGISQKAAAMKSPDSLTRYKSSEAESIFLLIDWHGSSGEQCNALFQFSDSHCEKTAQKAADALKIWVQAQGFEHTKRHAHQ